RSALAVVPGFLCRVEQTADARTVRAGGGRDRLHLLRDRIADGGSDLGEADPGEDSGWGFGRILRRARGEGRRFAGQRTASGATGFVARERDDGVRAVRGLHHG